MLDRRSNLEIEIDVLRTILDGVIKTSNIARGANLAYPHFKKIIKDLCKRGLVKYEKSNFKDKRIKHIYRITSKGQSFLFDSLIKIGSNLINCDRHEACKLINKLYCLNCGKEYVNDEY